MADPLRGWYPRWYAHRGRRVTVMHPIERLRYVARIGSDRPDLVAREAAGALLSCAGRPAELVVACRRLLDRQPAAGPLWWIVSRALTAPEPAAAIYAAL